MGRKNDPSMVFFKLIIRLELRSDWQKKDATVWLIAWIT